MSDALARLDRLKARFLDRCREDLAYLSKSDLSAAEAQTVAHRIAGMAGTLGLHELGAAAGALDQCIAHGRPYDAEFAALKGALARL